MKCALNIAEDNRILSACFVIPNGSCEGMPIVDMLPEGDLSDYLYVDGAYVYDPLPEPEQPEPTPSDFERIAALEAAMTAIEEGIASV